MIQRMPCRERYRLMQIYSDAARKLSQAVAVLRDSAMICDPETFDRAWERCEELAVLCADIRTEIYGHIKAHHCALELRRRIETAAAPEIMHLHS